MPDPNQTNPNQPTNPAAPVGVPAPSVFPQSDLPPLPPDFQNVSDDTGSAALPTEALAQAGPSDLPPMVSTPKKKFGGGRIIATILGILLLVGGVGAGLILTQQQQLFNQKASSCTALCLKNATPDECGCGGKVPAGIIIPPAGQTGSNAKNNNDGNPANDYVGVITPPAAPSTPSSNNTNCPSGQSFINGACVDSKTACQSSNTQACKDLCGDQPSAIQNTCVPSGVGGVSGWHWTNCIGGGTNGVGCGTGTNTSSGGKTTNTVAPTAPPVVPTLPPGQTAVCMAVTAYNSTWVAQTSTQLSTLKSGDIINFCVNGTASAGTFDKAKFTINGVVQAETTTVRPGSSDFCQNYTIPAGISSFNVTAQIHHATLGWSN